MSRGTRVVEVREVFPKEVGFWVGPKEGIQPPCQVGKGHSGQRDGDTRKLGELK